jgi:hypothetical protein
MHATPTSQDTMPPPAITLATLKTMLAKGRAAHPDLAGRMDKAAHILAARSVEPTGDDGRSWWVESETTPGQLYLVVRTLRGAWACTCKDHERRQDWCKHALAVALYQRCQEAQATPVPFPERAYADDDRVEITAAGLAYLATLDAPVPVA